MLPGISPQYLYLHRYAFVSQVEIACQDRFPLATEIPAISPSRCCISSMVSNDIQLYPQAFKEKISGVLEKDFLFSAKVAGGGTKSVPPVPTCCCQAFGEGVVVTESQRREVGVVM